MRLWSLHPRHLDAAGLVAAWREGLLAQAVLRGRTRGYRHHPQLVRFRECPAPVSAIALYLESIHREAGRRGYSFDARLVAPVRRRATRLTVTTGQLEYEWSHLKRKLRRRDPAAYRRLLLAARECHPLFRPIDGPVSDWESGARKRMGSDSRRIVQSGSRIPRKDADPT